MVRLLWTTSNNPIGTIIKFATGEDCTHFSFVFESVAKGVMFESNLLGTHPRFYESAKKKINIVHEKVYELPIEEENKLWDIVVHKFDGKDYDFKGSLFLGFWKFISRTFRVKMPEKNEWADPNKFWCNEVYEALNSVDGLPKIDLANGMDSPHDVFVKVERFENALRNHQ